MKYIEPFELDFIIMLNTVMKFLMSIASKSCNTLKSNMLEYELNMVGEQFNFRLDAQYSKKLKIAAEDKEMKPSSLAAEIIKKSLDFWEKKRERKEITQARFIISKYMNMLDISNIDKSIEDIASYILGEMKIQVGILNFDEFEKRIMKWNKENGIKLIKFEEKDSIIYMSQHDLGENWSMLQNKIYCKMFDKFGKTVISNEFDSTTFSITLANPN